MRCQAKSVTHLLGSRFQPVRCHEVFERFTDVHAVAFVCYLERRNPMFLLSGEAVLKRFAIGQVLYNYDYHDVAKARF